MTRASAGLPALDEAYPRYRGLLLSALGRFGARSIPVPPDQGLDLVHDFFAEEWEGLRRRFDPSRGSATPYVYSAFVRFSRARLIAAKRLREVPIDEWRVATAPESQGRAPQEAKAIENEERQRLEASLAALDRPERDLLLRFAETGVSERALAREFRMSRHAVRESLVDAVGHLIVDLVAPLLPSEDRPAAKALWKGLHTEQETARLLSMPLEDVRAVRRRSAGIFESYLDALRDRKRPVPGKETGGSKMNAQDAIRDVLFRQPVDSAGYREALKRLRADSEAAYAALEDLEGSLELAGDESEQARRSEDFYAAVSAGLGGETLPEDAAGAAHDPFADEKRGMAAEFDTLLASLPRGPESLLSMLQDLGKSERLGREELERFRREPDVMAWESKAADDLAAWGIGPASVWAARQAIADIIDRSYRSGAADRDTPLLLEPDGLSQRGELVVGADAIASVVASRAEVSPKVAGALYEWLRKAMEYAESVLPGVQVSAQQRDGTAEEEGDHRRRRSVRRRRSTEQEQAESEHEATAEESEARVRVLYD